jgi:hypothetical protein
VSHELGTNKFGAERRAATSYRRKPDRAARANLKESVWRELKVLAAKTDSTIDALMRRGLDHIFAEHRVNRGAADS